MWLVKKNPKCDCDADRTLQSHVIVRVVNGQRRRAQRIWHRRGDMLFWHWSDQDVKKV